MKLNSPTEQEILIDLMNKLKSKRTGIFIEDLDLEDEILELDMKIHPENYHATDSNYPLDLPFSFEIENKNPQSSPAIIFGFNR